jgi:hypothetical protein
MGLAAGVKPPAGMVMATQHGGFGGGGGGGHGKGSGPSGAGGSVTVPLSQLAFDAVGFLRKEVAVEFGFGVLGVGCGLSDAAIPSRINKLSQPPPESCDHATMQHRRAARLTTAGTGQASAPTS